MLTTQLSFGQAGSTSSGVCGVHPAAGVQHRGRAGEQPDRLHGDASPQLTLLPGHLPAGLHTR